MAKIIMRIILLSLLISLFQGCNTTRRAPTLNGVEENTYVAPDSNMNYIYRAPSGHI